MRVAYLGIKGLPSRGGAERVVEAIVKRMPSLGVEPTIYCDQEFTPSEFAMSELELIRIPTIKGKHLRSTSMNIAAAIHAVFRGQYDLIHLHNIEASYVIPLLRTRYKVISTSHGFAHLREKWNPLAKRIMQTMERPFVKFSNLPTSVSKKDAQLLSEKYNRKIEYIPNGVGIEYEPDNVASRRILQKHGLIPGEYLIFVAGRIIPTKGCHLAIDAVNQLEADFPLLIVGDESTKCQAIEFASKNYLKSRVSSSVLW
jgi:glycosyltransferase involved in cell wall biosynthesis